MTVYVCACVCVYACVLETLLLPYYILKVNSMDTNWICYILTLMGSLMS